MNYESSKNIKLLVIGITRNGGFLLKYNIYKLLKLRKFFQNVDFCIYENDSTDGTKEYLTDLTDKIDGFKVLSEQIDEKKCAEIITTKTVDGAPCRIELISYARNRLLDFIKPFANNYDYILNIDLDILVHNTKQIVKTFERFKNISFDCITGCGLTKWLRYRDAYAFRTSEFPFGPEFLNEYWWQVTVHQIQKRYPKNLKLSVFSAFGGAAIYKTEAYLSSEYNCHCNEEFLKNHEKIDKSNADSEQIKHCSLKPVPNTQYLTPIICEHVPFHYRMRENGFDKIFVDTSWRFIFKD